MIVIYKALIIFFFIAVALRFMGKREIGELGMVELVVILIIADLGVVGIEDKETELYYYLIAIFIIVVLQKLIAFLSLKSNFFRKIADGKMTFIIENGKLNIRSMRLENYSMDDLLSQLRSKGIYDIENVSFAILESNGELNVQKKEDSLTHSLPVIVSGEYQKKTLNLLNISKDKVLKDIGNIDIKRILYANYTNNKIYYILLD